MKRTKSAEAFELAKRLIPGGVNSPVRAFKSVGGDPFFVRKGSGARIWDADGNEYVDFVCSWGPLILGHAHPVVVEAVTRVVSDGMTFGIPTERETELAGALCDAIPSMKKVRLCSSGTEAAMSGIRAARGFTRRDLVVKFDGCYHGHSDGLLAKAGSGVATLGLPDSAGVPASFTSCTIVLPYNDAGALAACFDAHGSKIAAVILEPVAGNMGVVLPERKFLESCRELTRSHGALLIFDEVITGFRICYGGVQKILGIEPDITVLGKIVGGGMPLAAYGGREDVMNMIAPVGPVYQAGTLSGNPAAVAAGIATLSELKRPGFYEKIETRGRRFFEGLVAAAKAAGVEACGNSIGSMGTLFFRGGEVKCWDDVKKSDTSAYARFFRKMLERGFYFAPSQFEAAFVSAAHTDADVDTTLRAAEESFATD
ncbi:MAG: glutamate-1-semialdehyde 2,1-aminomutase [Deltaproteobacteria bacterium]|nr:glutamate-1-semialdehyde 2,1-aminomutase [Deltaproteobacteria bacterium]